MNSPREPDKTYWATNVKRDSGTKRGQAKKSHRVSLD